MLKFNSKSLKSKILPDSFRICAWACIFSLISPNLSLASSVAKPIPQSEAVVSMDFKDISLKDFLKIFSMQTGLNFIASEAVQDRQISLYFDKVPVREAAEQIFKANNLSYEYDDLSNIILVKDWGVPAIETMTKVYPLKYARVSSSSLQADVFSYIVQGKGDIKPASETGGGGGGGGEGGGGVGAGTGRWKSEEESGITYALKKIISANGSIIEDAPTNSLIITDVPSRFPVIESIIKQLDVPQPQVLLEVEILDVSKNAIDNIGVKFGQTPLVATITGAARKWGFPWKSWSEISHSEQMGLIDLGPSADFNIMLEYLSTLSDTKYLARPRLLTLSNESAEIKIMTNEVIGEIINLDDAGNEISRTAERTETGVSLRVTPQVNPLTGEITMFVFPRVVEAATSAFSEAYRDPEARGTKSIVKVKDGDTIIIGGLIRNQRNETTTKLPFFGDIPILGKFLTHKAKEKDQERELVIFITPRIIKEPRTKLASIPRNVKVVREQDSMVASERMTSMDSTLDKLEKKKRK